MKISKCVKCGSLFMPMSSKDTVCTNCRNAVRKAIIGECEITETRGRCMPFIKGECRDCWNYVLVENWIGWHSNICENHVGIKLSGDDE